jgi:hypothetical protein
MNDKIAKTMLYLCIGYLSVFYVLKFFFPELLIQVISSPALIRLGEFIGIWVGFEYIVRIISNFIVFYLFACASCGKFKFEYWKLLIILGFAIANNIVSDLLPELYTHTCISFMLITALICNAKLDYVVISFVVHGYLSQFLAKIRGFETIFVYINAVSGILLNLEVDVWLLLLTIIFYFKENKNGRLCTPLPQQEC